jgi:berberine-like enzyme
MRASAHAILLQNGAIQALCYVNDCGMDMVDFATAYWGDNLARLRQVKAQYDPANLFRHAQSVPLP